MRKAILVVVFLCVMAVVNLASADTIRGINIDFVNIGNASNAADTTGYGAVSYNYRFGKYEVTNAQWDAFKAAAGTPTGTPDNAYLSTSYYTESLQPANRISWYAALQFCNYLTSGDKSIGVYKFSGDDSNPGSFLGIDRPAAQASYGKIYFLPTEDEWYKAAFFKPDCTGYSLYVNGTNTAPISGANSNYYNMVGKPWNVGTGIQEQNGTFDMMGNVYEWNETLLDSTTSICRGGSYGSPASWGTSLARNYSYPYDPTFIGIGFRVASVPEPATLLLLSLGAVMFVRQRTSKHYVCPR